MTHCRRVHALMVLYASLRGAMAAATATKARGGERVSSGSPARSRAEIAIRRLERALVALFAEHSPGASFTCAAWRTYIADHCLALAPQQISNAALGRDAMRKITQPFALPDSCNLPAGWALWHTAKFADDWAPVQDLIIKACDLGGDDL